MKADTIIEVLKDIKTVLDPTSFDYYNEVAPITATYPFLTYEIDNSFSDGDSTEVVPLYLNGWDEYKRTSSTLELETMMSDVLKLLHRRTHNVTEDFGFWYNLDGRRDLRDTDDNIRRRRHRYQIRVFGKE